MEIGIYITHNIILYQGRIKLLKAVRCTLAYI